MSSGFRKYPALNLNLPPEFGVPSLQVEFLTGLEQALAVRGLPYQVVGRQNFELSLLGGAIA